MTDDPQYFILKVGVCFCRCDIRVNDIPLLTQDVSGSRIDLELPLNQHVFTGENAVSFRILPAQGSEQAAVTVVDWPEVIPVTRKTAGKFGVSADFVPYLLQPTPDDVYLIDTTRCDAPRLSQTGPGGGRAVSRFGTPG